MTKLFIIEARRLVPFAVLFVMLLVVSIYDGLTAPSIPVVTEPNSVPYRSLAHSALGSEGQIQVVTDQDMWVAMHRALGLHLTNHEFNPEQEVAVFLLNCQLRSTALREKQLELHVIPRPQTYQLILFQRTHLPGGGAEIEFVLRQQEGGSSN